MCSASKALHLLSKLNSLHEASRRKIYTTLDMQSHSSVKSVC